MQPREFGVSLVRVERISRLHCLVSVRWSHIFQRFLSYPVSSQFFTYSTPDELSFAFLVQCCPSFACTPVLSLRCQVLPNFAPALAAPEFLRRKFRISDLGSRKLVIRIVVSELQVLTFLGNVRFANICLHAEACWKTDICCKTEISCYLQLSSLFGVDARVWGWCNVWSFPFAGLFYSRDFVLFSGYKVCKASLGSIVNILSSFCWYCVILLSAQLGYL